MDLSLTGLLTLLLVIFGIYYVLHLFVFKTWNYFADRGIVFDRGLPFFGSFAAAMLCRESMPDNQVKLYKRYAATHRFIGIYQMGGQPMYLINDPELIKAITVKDYDHFLNHGFQIDAEMDPLMGRILFFMHGEEWRELRSILSPLFTGSKMRSMLALMGDTIEDFVGGVRDEVRAAGPNQGVEYNLMDLYQCSTNDAIASCAFGLKINSFKDKRNEFYVAGKALTRAVQSAKIFFIMSFPRICKWLRVKVIAESQNKFFRDIVHRSVEDRKRHGIVRNDMIHLLTLLRDGQLDAIAEKDDLQDAGFATTAEFITAKATEKLKNFTDDDLVSQCLLFFIAGFTGVANTLSFLSYELAINPDIQDKLYAEIAEVAATLNGDKVTYETLQKMKYLDMVVSETLRIWSANIMVERRVNKQYVLENTDGSKVVLQPGETVWIPAFAIQHDANYYPNPDKFDPERFSAERKHEINPFTYMPFGIGPRACIASRFALTQLKATAFHLLQNFRIEAGPNTMVPLKLKTKPRLFEPENGFLLQLKLRD